MVCIDKIYSVSAMIGNGSCNAKCKFCAGCVYRKEAREMSEDYQLRLNFEKNLESAIKLCSHNGGWSLSLTSAGEPTMCPSDVTNALWIYKEKCAKEGASLPNINLFTNGILFGDKTFCQTHLREWKRLGLTNVAISIHSPNRLSQGDAYGIGNDYPYLSDIIQNIKAEGVGVRATLLLNKQYVGTCKQFVQAIEQLTGYYSSQDPYCTYYNVKCVTHCGSGHSDIDNITCWPIGNPDGSRNEFTPSRWELFKIKLWLALNTKKCHGHVWGGGVYDYCGNIIRLTDYVTPHDPKKDFVRQLVVFPKGDVCYSWIKEGALCMK